jgi:hypothetical protein
MNRGVIQAIEHGAEYYGDGDGQHGNPAAVGGGLDEFRVGPQLIIETGLATDIVVGERRTIGIVRVGLVGHERFPSVVPYQPPAPKEVPGNPGRFREPGRFGRPIPVWQPVYVLLFNLFRTEPADYSEGDPGSREEDATRQ